MAPKLLLSSFIIPAAACLAPQALFPAGPVVQTARKAGSWLLFSEEFHVGLGKL